MASIIEIKQLSIGYSETKNDKLVAQNLNATLHEGEMTCLLGANGQGKSTLMKTMCGFLNPLAGYLSLNGKQIYSLSEKQMAKQIAVVLTEKISVPNATVYELVAYGRSPFTGFLGKLSSSDKGIVNKAIKQCGIAHKKHSLLSTLSDGERQKATIAKALAQDTPFILLDEPTAFLDLPARVEIMQLLRQLATQSGKAILMSTHDLDLALQMADKLWLLNTNNVVCGSPEDLLLTNAFQSMFSKGGVAFDNKTGLFTVQYQHFTTLHVMGHGFEFVLLRRAFARKGIKLVKCKHTEQFWINISNNDVLPFTIMKNNCEIAKFNSVEQVVKIILKLLSAKNQLVLNQELILQ